MEIGLCSVACALQHFNILKYLCHVSARLSNSPVVTSCAAKKPASFIHNLKQEWAVSEYQYLKCVFQIAVFNSISNTLSILYFAFTYRVRDVVVDCISIPKRGGIKYNWNQYNFGFFFLRDVNRIAKAWHKEKWNGKCVGKASSGCFQITLRTSLKPWRPAFEGGTL